MFRFDLDNQSYMDATNYSFNIYIYVSLLWLTGYAKQCPS